MFVNIFGSQMSH